MLKTSQQKQKFRHPASPSPSLSPQSSFKSASTPRRKASTISRKGPLTPQTKALNLLSQRPFSTKAPPKHHQKQNNPNNKYPKRTPPQSPQSRSSPSSLPSSHPIHEMSEQAPNANQTGQRAPKQKTLTAHQVEETQLKERVMGLLRKLEPNPESVDWTSTHESLGRTDHPDYMGVLMSEKLLLPPDQRQAHYAQAWDLYRTQMNSPQTIVAPMVEQSELPFRVLSNRYKVDIAYTPMLNSNQINTLSHLQKLFETDASQEAPLTVQICGASVDLVVGLCELLKTKGDKISDININLGCPQGIARRGRYGSFLLEETMHVQRIVRALKEIAHVPVTVKMRKLLNDDTYARTLAYAKALQDSGASIITLHGRTRNNKQEKIGQADLEAIRLLKAHLSIPVFANGGVGSFFDAKRIQKFTGVDGVMISEGILGFPTMISHPIRRSHLLHHSERPPTEEACYRGATEVESEEQRKHYSYGLWDQKEFKEHPFTLLPQELRQMPMLSATTSAPDLEYLDQQCGPDPVQVAAELVEITDKYSPEWLSCLRPHIFKILNRELSTHTDLRLIYAMNSTSPRSDFAMTQLVRQREHYAWSIFKSELLTALRKRLSLPHNTPIEDIDTSSISKEDLGKMMQDFDFQALREHLDALPFFSQALNVIKAGQHKAPAQDLLKFFAHPNGDGEQKEHTQNENEPNQQNGQDEQNEQKNETKMCCGELNHPAEDEIARVLYEAAVNASAKSQAPVPVAGGKPQKSELRAGGTVGKNNENDENDDTGNTEDGQKEVPPQLAPDHKYPVRTHPWTQGKTKLLWISSGKKAALQQSFDHVHWYSHYEQWCIDNGFLLPMDPDVEQPVVVEEEKELPKANKRSNHQKFAPVPNQYPAITKRLVTPTPKGFQPNRTDGSTTWTGRHVQDREWVRIMKLQGENNKVVQDGHEEAQNEQHTPPVTRIPQPTPLYRYIPPLPLESTWFFERLYGSIPHWYYRYKHQNEVIHLPVDEHSISQQLDSMRKARQDKEARAVKVLEAKGQPGMKPEERDANKQKKLERKQQQRLEQEGTEPNRKIPSTGSKSIDADAIVDVEGDMDLDGGEKRALEPHVYSDDEKHVPKRTNHDQ